MKMVNGGVTIEVDPADAQRYLRAGYVLAEERPVEIPADPQPEPEAVEPKARKVAKKGKLNGNN